MKIKTFGYFIKEALSSFKSNSLMTIASIGSVASTLIILGIFLIITINIDIIAETVEDQVEITAYIEDELSDEEARVIGLSFNDIQGIDEITFVSKKDALEEFKESLGDQDGILDGMELDNPLPNSYRIKTQSPDQVESVALQVGRVRGVEEVIYGKELVEQLFNITNLVRLVGLSIMAIFILISIFIISNTIKLTVYARRKEINIMKYIGATDWFIRWPFFIEGMVLGFLGSIISVGLVYYLYSYIIGLVTNNIVLLTLMQPDFFLYDISPFLIGAGTLIGAIGSSISIRRFLRV